MVDKENAVERIYIGSKDIQKYLTACFFALGEKGVEQLEIVGRGNNVKRAVDVAAVLIRQYIENPEYKVKIGSEEFEERYVSTIEININGRKKESKSK